MIHPDGGRYGFVDQGVQRSLTYRFQHPGCFSLVRSNMPALKFVLSLVCDVHEMKVKSGSKALQIYEGRPR
jgi:hypothetical protein